jgi:MSHA biogenesis protein MshO
VFLRGPITSYFDTERRADLSGAGGLAMAKLSQEISRAVPNSVRVTTVSATEFYLEFLPVLSEGRYRSTAPPSNPLDLGIPDTSFDVLGFPVLVNAGNWVVVNNYLAAPGGDVWAGNTRAAYTGVTGVVGTITFLNHTFPALPPPPPTVAPDRRFQIAGQPVIYACRAGELRRHSGYPFQAAQVVNAASPQITAASENDLLADGITACRAMSYPGNLRRAQVVALALNFENAGDRLNLYHAIRVESLP